MQLDDQISSETLGTSQTERSRCAATPTNTASPKVSCSDLIRTEKVLRSIWTCVNEKQETWFPKVNCSCQISSYPVCQHWQWRLLVLFVSHLLQPKSSECLKKYIFLYIYAYILQQLDCISRYKGSVQQRLIINKLHLHHEATRWKLHSSDSFSAEPVRCGPARPNAFSASYFLLIIRLEVSHSLLEAARWRSGAQQIQFWMFGLQTQPIDSLLWPSVCRQASLLLHF